MNSSRKPNSIGTETTSALAGTHAPTPATVQTAGQARTAKAVQAAKSKAKQRREEKFAERLREAGWTCTPPSA